MSIFWSSLHPVRHTSPWGGVAFSTVAQKLNKVRRARFNGSEEANQMDSLCIARCSVIQPRVLKQRGVSDITVFTIVCRLRQLCLTGVYKHACMTIAGEIHRKMHWQVLEGGQNDCRDSYMWVTASCWPLMAMFRFLKRLIIFTMGYSFRWLSFTRVCKHDNSCSLGSWGLDDPTPGTVV